MRTIAWDVDDVLNSLMRVWFEKSWLPGHPSPAVTYQDLGENPPHRALGIGIEAYRSSLDEFRHSEAYAQMAPEPDVLNWFRANGSRFHHVALTAVPLHAAHRSAWWVLKHYGSWIRTFHFVPSEREGEAIPSYDADKASYLRRLGQVVFFVDDNDENVCKAREAGIRAEWFPRPWNGNRALTVGAFLSTLSREVREHHDATG